MGIHPVQGREIALVDAGDDPPQKEIVEGRLGALVFPGPASLHGLHRKGIAQGKVARKSVVVDLVRGFEWGDDQAVPDPDRDKEDKDRTNRDSFNVGLQPAPVGQGGLGVARPDRFRQVGTHEP